MDSSVLLRSRIFDGLSEPERERWLARGTSSSLKRGDTLARQGEPARRFYLVESGFLKLLQVTAEGTEVIARFLSPGEPFGGIVALGDMAYPVTAIATQASVVRAWPRETVDELLSEYPQVRVNLMREMAHHMTDALTPVRELTTATSVSVWRTHCCVSPGSADRRQRAACSSASHSPARNWPT